MLESALERLGHGLAAFHFEPRPEQIGTVLSVGHGVAQVQGLPGVRLEELVEFPAAVAGGQARYGLAYNLDPEQVGVVVLDDPQGLAAGSPARCTGRLLDVPVGRSVLGRVLDPLGRPLDGQGPLTAAQRLPVERPAPAVMARAPVRVPLQTGIKAIDALLPIGRGQRMLILGDRQTGKSALAIDTILHQRDQGVLCIYCFIAQRAASVAATLERLKSRGALDYTAVVVARGEDPPGLQYLAPYAATSMAEHFMEEGQDALIVYDDLTRHARAYRELSLLLRRPPGREAFPGDIFYAHSRLLERSTRLLTGGSLTALPVVETEGQQMAAYIPTNLVSITDGQIILSPGLFQKAVLPAIDLGTSVSRVGGDAQLPAYRAVSGELRLAYAQFQELEAFSRLASRLDDATLASLERGRRIREVLKQDQLCPQSASDQIAVLLAATQGLLDPVPLEQVKAREERLVDSCRARAPQLMKALGEGHPLTEKAQEDLLAAMRQADDG